MDAVTSKKQLNYTEKSWSYKDICSMRFRTVLPCDCFTYDDVTGTYVDLRDTEAGLKYLFDQGLDIKVVGIAKAAEGSVSSDMNRYIGYTSELTKYIIDRTSKSNIVAAQKENPNTDIFTGLPFQDKKGNIKSITYVYSVGVAKVYALRFRYWNGEAPRNLHVTVKDKNGVTYVNTDVAFLQSQMKKTKRKMSSITTGSQTNAGTYTVTITGEGLDKMEFDYLAID